MKKYPALEEQHELDWQGLVDNLLRKGTPARAHHMELFHDWEIANAIVERYGLAADLDENDLPETECLKDTVERFLPYWHETIAPTIKEGKKVVIAAHGNSLRALVKYLDNVSDEEILKLNIPTGVPLVYELDDDLKPLNSYYLGDQAAIEAAMQAVANQGKAAAK